LHDGIILFLVIIIIEIVIHHLSVSTGTNDKRLSILGFDYPKNSNQLAVFF
jgi:hypothetical protein